MSLDMRYGRPNAARTKTRKGFREGGGEDEWFGAEEGGRPRNDAKADGVREVASAGGGRPLTLANKVRSQRRIVNMPRIEPSVLRRFVNCSATETMAAGDGFSDGRKKLESRCSPTKLECVAIYVLSSIWATPWNALTMLSMIWKVAWVL